MSTKTYFNQVLPECDKMRIVEHDRWLGCKREDVRAWFAGAGLTDVKADGVGEKCRSTSISSGEKIEINIFVAT